MVHSYVWHDSFICRVLIFVFVKHVRPLQLACTWCVWFIHTCDMIHTYTPYSWKMWGLKNKTARCKDGTHANARTHACIVFCVISILRRPAKRQWHRVLSFQCCADIRLDRPTWPTSRRWKRKKCTNWPPVTPFLSCMCMCVCACVCMSICVYECMHVREQDKCMQYTYKHICTYRYTYMCTRNRETLWKSVHMYRMWVIETEDRRWLRLVGSLKLQISFAEYTLFYRALLQKRPIILGSLLIVATS